MFVAPLDSAKIRKHSVLVAGHQTSVSLEDAFWTYLKLIGQNRGVSLNAIVTEVDVKRTGNLSSALRIFVLNHIAGGDFDSE